MRLIDSNANVTSTTVEQTKSGDARRFVQVDITGAGTDTPSVAIEGRMASDLSWFVLDSGTTSRLVEINAIRYIRAVVTGQAASPKNVKVEIGV